MLLFLVRHAHALTEAENPVRPLSARGRGEVARLARFFAGNGCFAPAQVWHSPLARSRETTDELLRRLALDPVVVETPGLLPEDDPQATADRLAMHPADRGDLALIGHEPHLSALAGLLVQGKATADVVRMRKAAALALEPTGDVHKKTGLARWRVRWHVSPELLPAVTVALPAPIPPAPVFNPASPAS
jgi:phosphohistidine phosphatase